MFVDRYIKENNIDKSELAYELFNFDESGKYKKEVNNILKEFTKKGEAYPDRQDIFLKVIDIIGVPQTPKERYIVAESYLWSRYPFKLKGIKYGELYINNEMWKENYFNRVIPINVEDSIKIKENIEKAHFIHEIGIVYESEYEFEKALEKYEEEAKLTPFWASGYIGISKILVKLGRCNDALQLLKETRKSEYYKPYSIKIYEWEEDTINDDFKICIEKEIQDIQKKIDRNYKYKSRPSKCVWKKEYYNSLSDLQKEHVKEYIDKGLVILE